MRPALLSLALCSCTTIIDNDPPSETTCGAVSFGESTVLATAIAYERGWLLGHGRTVFFGDATAASVQAFDVCNGTRVNVASLESLGGATVIEGALYFTGAENDGAKLYRFREVDGIQTLANLPAVAPLASVGSRLFTLRDEEVLMPGEEPDVSIVEIALTPEPEFRVLHTIKARYGTSAFLVGASEAGLYLQKHEHCSCNPQLTLYPVDGGAPKTVEHTAGAMSIAVVGEKLLAPVDLDPMGKGESSFDIVSLPLTGGEPDVLLAKSDEHTGNVSRIATDERSVCFLPYGRGPRCLNSAGKLHVLDEPTQTIKTGPLVLSGGILAWLREGRSGFELVATLPP